MATKVQQVKKRHVRGLLVFAAFMAALVVITAVYVVVSRPERFVYADHLDETIITVDGTAVTLREFGYYIYEVEGFVQRQALIYDETDPAKYWNTHYSAGMDSTYMFDYASKTALATCVFDYVYAHDAESEQLLLNAELTEKAERETRFFYGGMSAAQREITALTPETVLEIELRRALAAEYIKLYASRNDTGKYGEVPGKALAYDGLYYKNEILPKHKVTYNDDLIEKIRFGTITVNRAA